MWRVGLALFLWVGLTASAQAAPARARVAVVPAGNPDPDTLSPVLWRMRAAIARVDGVQLVRVADQLANEAPEDALEGGRVALDEGAQAMNDGDLERAIRAYETAARLLTSIPAGRRDASAALMGLATARGAMKDGPGATAAFARLLKADPDLVIDDEGFSPTMRTALANAQRGGKAGSRRGAGRVRIDAVPGPAAVFLDGRFRGTTPVLLDDLSGPTAPVRVEYDGYAPWVREVVVRPGQGLAIEAALEPLSRAALYEDLIDKLPAQMEREQMSVSLKEMKALLSIDQAVLVRLQGSTVEAALYDLNANRRVRPPVRASLGADRRLAPGAAEALIEALYDDVDAQAPGQSELLPEEPASFDDEGEAGPLRALTRRWWFWPAVGVAAATAVIVPVAIVATDRDPAIRGKDGTGAVILRF